MARIRSVKPELFINEQVGDVSMAARVFFIGLFTQADKAGRVEWLPKRIKVQLFPYDEGVDVEALAAELVDHALARTYCVNGVWYLDLPTFPKHQRPHPKEPESFIPACPIDWPKHGTPWKETASRVLPGSFPTSPARKGREGDLGREGKESPIGVSEADAEPATKPARYQHALVKKRDLSAFWEGPIFNIPGHWATKAIKASNGKAFSSDVVRFAQALTARLEREDGEAPTENFLGWLDTEWAAFHRPKVSDGYRSVSELLEQQAREQAARDAEEAAAKAAGTYQSPSEILRSSRLGRAAVARG